MNIFATAYVDHFKRHLIVTIIEAVSRSILCSQNRLLILNLQKNETGFAVLLQKFRFPIRSVIIV